MKAHALAGLLMLCAPLAAHAQSARLKLPDFSELSSKAAESVDINLDGEMLKSAGPFMAGPGKGAPPPEVQKALEGISGVYIRVFEFDKPDMYSRRDLDRVHAQLQAPGWKKMMSVNSREERVDMYMHDGQGRPEGGGFAMVVSEPTEFVIVNVVGKVDLESLRHLQGKMGVPGMPGMMGGPPPAPGGRAAPAPAPAPSPPSPPPAP